MLGKGNHEIKSSWNNQFDHEIATTLGITCSNVTFLGSGKDTTTILGGIGIYNSENITFKQMTVTNTTGNGHGISMSNAKVELFDVALKGYGANALYILPTTSATTVVATRCEFANSRIGALIYGSLTTAKFYNCVFQGGTASGIYAYESTIHLHGEGTAIHSNGVGICAHNSAKVIIHLPSHHNTSYNNRLQDRETLNRGTITNVED